MPQVQKPKLRTWDFRRKAAGLVPVLRSEMKIGRDLLVSAMRQIVRNRRRYKGAVLALAVGIAGLITVKTLGDGVEQRLGRNLEMLGSATVVEAQWDEGQTARSRDGSYTFEDVKDLRELEGVMAVAPVIWKYSERLTHGRRTAVARVGGVDESYFRVVPLKVQYGRQLDGEDNKQVRRVCTIGEDLAMTLFSGTVEAVGSVVVLRGIPFKVVGVLDWNVDPLYKETCLIPLYVAFTQVPGMDRIRHLRVRAEGWGEVPNLFVRVQGVLKTNQPDLSDSMTVSWYQGRIDVIRKTVILFRGLAYAFVLVVLVLGALAISNLMTAAVVERTREIGLRVAMGATPRAILVQFLSESIAVTLLAAVLGLALSFVTLEVSSRVLETTHTFSGVMQRMMGAVFIAICLGVVSGLIPARRARSLSCVEALRFE